VRKTTIDEWLSDLASDKPAPGGGAAAGVNAAMGAALVSMVCNLTIGKPKFAEHEAVMREVLAEAERLRGEALQLAEDDAEAFSGVVAAYKLPKSSDEEKAARTAAIQSGLVEAAAVPLAVARVAGFERRQMLIEAPQRAALQRLLARWSPSLPALRGTHKAVVRWAVDVDPLTI